MRKEMRVFVGALLMAGFSVAAVAGDRVDRAVKGDAIGLHLVSSSPQEGFRPVTTTAGSRIYVSARPTWTSLDVLSVTELPGRSGSTLAMRLSGNASNRLTEQMNRVRDTQVALFSGKSIIAMAEVSPDGSLTITGITPDRSERIRRIVDSAPVAPSGPLVTVVAAGQVDGEYLVDVYVEGVDSLRGYQVRLTTGGGESGSLELRHVGIDQAREDFVFHGSNVINANAPLLRQLASVRSDGPVAADEARYIGTYAFTPTPDASGLFRVNVEAGTDSVLVGGRNTEMGFSVGADARIFVASDGKGTRNTK